jgi:hypothetical protein
MRQNVSRPTSRNIVDLHRIFVSLMPRIEKHGHVYFRHKTPDKREELIAEMVGVSWRWFVRLVQRGKDPTAFVSAIASYAARAVNAGRRVCGMEKPKDVLSPLAQCQKGFKVESIPTSTCSHETLYSVVAGQRQQDVFEERLRDNTQTPVPDQVSFRLDFPAWLQTRTDRDRHLIEALMAGERTMDVAEKHGLSPARISQLRREFLEDWEKFWE